MPSLQEYTKKLKSLGNTLKITKTMKMVSASKLRRAQESQSDAKDYADKVTGMIARLSGAVGAGAHPLLDHRENPKKILILLFTSDKGLCGGFNNNLIKFTNRWIAEQEDKEITMSFCGRRGYMFFSKRNNVDKHYEEVTAQPNFTDASRIGNELCEDFLSETYDEVYMAHNIFHNPLSQEPVMEKLLPVEPEEIDNEAAEHEISQDYIFEPKQQELLQELIPRTVNFRVYYTLLENAAGEHGARMTAMDNATTNAENMIESYTLLRNRARQAAITTELIEIISGAEAL